MLQLIGSWGRHFENSREDDSSSPRLPFGNPPRQPMLANRIDLSGLQSLVGQACRTSTQESPKGCPIASLIEKMIVQRKPDEEAEMDITKQNRLVVVGFRNAYVFDRLSRDLRPARVRLVNRATQVDRATAGVSSPNQSLLCEVWSITASVLVAQFSKEAFPGNRG
jgi:hypothetical protein